MQQDGDGHDLRGPEMDGLNRITGVPLGDPIDNALLSLRRLRILELGHVDSHGEQDQEPPQMKSRPANTRLYLPGREPDG